MTVRALAAALLFAAAPPAVADGIAGRFDFYVLTLDWAPRDCPSDDPAATACRPGDHAFLFHMLWPHRDAGDPPTSCLTMLSSELAPATYAALGNVLPRSLAMQEWEARGVCTGLRAVDYFALTREAIANLVIPADFVRPGFPQRLTPRQIEDAFIAVNPSLMLEATSVQCRRGAFTGLKLCLSKDLAFRPCQEVRAAACEGASISIPAVLR